MSEAALTVMGRGIFPVIFKTPGGKSIVFWVSELQVPAKSGSLGILDGRRPVVSSLEDGVVRLKTGAGWKAVFTSGAVLRALKPFSVYPEVLRTYRVTVIIYSARQLIDLSELDEDAVREEYALASSEDALAITYRKKLIAEKRFKRAKAKMYAFQNAEAALTGFV